MEIEKLKFILESSAKLAQLCYLNNKKTLNIEASIFDEGRYAAYMDILKVIEQYALAEESHHAI